jgi:glutamate-1-semialdehyde aminotransferase
MDEPEVINERSLVERSGDVIPGGSSTGSKTHAALFGSDADPELPAHYTRATGCEVTLADGSTVIDCTMALGAVAIGYADSVVNESVIQALVAGNVSGFAPTLEIEIAERLSEVIPVAERVRFLKSGAEATAAAVRLARAVTGRERILGAGYFGWHDWSSTQRGVPRSTQSLYTAIPYNDLAALDAESAAAGSELAAIILEPVVEELATPEWVNRAREICDRQGALLIFDEIKTGFRLRTAGYQEFSGILPDVAVFGKAMANGFPLAAVVGKKEVMSEAERNWISSTLACETSALAAAGAVLDWHERAEVCDSLGQVGEEMRRAFQSSMDASGIEGVTLGGIDPMWFFRFESETRMRRFLSLALQLGVLFKRGPYNFPSLSHDDDALRAIEHACSTAMVQLLDEELTEGNGETEAD